MSPGIQQAVILAAGRGSRLRPVTDHTPKALVPFFGLPLIDFAAAHLVDAGVRRIAVNTYYLGEAIARHVNTHLVRRYPEVEWFVSSERFILGTGGGLANLGGWLDHGPFWIVNADAVFTESLPDLGARHLASGADATWMVTRHPSFSGLRTVVVEDERVVRVTPESRAEGYVFCGVHVASRGLLSTLPAEKRSCVVRHGYEPWISAGADVRAVETHGFWADTGTPARYVDAHRRGLAHVDVWRRLGCFQRAGRSDVRAVAAI